MSKKMKKRARVEVIDITGDDDDTDNDDVEILEVPPRSLKRRRSARLQQQPSTTTTPPAKAKTKKSPPLLTCSLCEEAMPHGVALTCPQKHECCHQCAADYVTKTWASREIPAPPSPLICCFACKFAYDDTALLRTLASADCPEAFKCLDKGRQEYQRQATIQELTKKLQNEKNEEKEAILLEEKLKGLMHNPRMCPKCKYGPVDKRRVTDCNYLGQRAHGGAFSSNACPSCGFFGANYTDWSKWDGKLRYVNESIKTPSSNPQERQVSSRPVSSSVMKKRPAARAASSSAAAAASSSTRSSAGSQPGVFLSSRQLWDVESNIVARIVSASNGTRDMASEAFQMLARQRGYFSPRAWIRATSTDLHYTLVDPAVAIVHAKMGRPFYQR